MPRECAIHVSAPRPPKVNIEVQSFRDAACDNDRSAIKQLKSYIKGFTY